MITNPVESTTVTCYTLLAGLSHIAYKGYWLTLSETTVCNKSCVHDYCKIHRIWLRKGLPAHHPLPAHVLLYLEIGPPEVQ